MFGFRTKKLVTPESNETKEVDVVELYYVRWFSRYGEFSGDTRKEMEAFTSKGEADEFAESLRNAFKLIRITANENKVTVTAKKC